MNRSVSVSKRLRDTRISVELNFKLLPDNRCRLIVALTSATNTRRLRAIATVVIVDETTRDRGVRTPGDGRPISYAAFPNAVSRNETSFNPVRKLGGIRGVSERRAKAFEVHRVPWPELTVHVTTAEKFSPTRLLLCSAHRRRSRYRRVQHR